VSAATSQGQRRVVPHPNAAALVLALAGCSAVPAADADPDLVATPDGVPAARYEHAPFDPARALDTCKVFHHVLAPDGRVLTKGLGGDYPHHRGLFFGFHRVQCGAERFDFWHCDRGESQRHVAFADAAALGLGGAGWQVARIDWCAADGAPVIHETRAVRAAALAAHTTSLTVVSELRAAGARVRIGGDPQHSGHQFRALQQFAAPGAEPVRYLRPGGARAAADDVWTDCDWIAAVLPLPDGAVTVLRVEGRDNPRPARWSTRPYGRFGATFAYALEPGVPLRLCWTYVVMLGEADAAWCAATASRARAGSSTSLAADFSRRP
jgi:hypothetical protein